MWVHKVKSIRLRNLHLGPEDIAVLERMAHGWNDHPRPVLFAGAGLTAYHSDAKDGGQTRAIGWKELAGRWIKAFEREGVKDLPTDPLRLAQLQEQAHGRSALIDTLEKAVPERELAFGAAFRELAGIPWGAIITTNYDSLIEQALESTQQQHLKIARDSDLTRKRLFSAIPVIKMHGDFCHRDLIVITEDDYNAYRRTRPAIATKVEQILIEHPILFVGFSLDDPNVSRILNWVRATVGTLQLPSISIVHSKPSRAEIELWASRGIRLIQCGTDTSLGDLLAALDQERESPATVESDPEDDATGATILDSIEHAVESSTIDGDAGSVAGIGRTERPPLAIRQTAYLAARRLVIRKRKSVESCYLRTVRRRGRELGGGLAPLPLRGNPGGCNHVDISSRGRRSTSWKTARAERESSPLASAR